MPTTRHGLSSTAIEQLIAQCVADAIVAYKENQNSGNGIQNEASSSASGVEHTAHGCSYKDFLNSKPRYFDRTKRVVGLRRWFEKMKSVFRICNCAENCQVKYATCTLLDKLALLCLVMVTPEYKKVERYIWGLTKYIQGKVASLKSAKIQEAIRMAHDLMDQVVKAKIVKDSDNKRN
ncbi:hypothetical protein Tco_1197903 [Tanacetum coccineum]